MGFSATERHDRPERRFPERVGALFQLIMQLRMLVAAIALLLLPPERIDVEPVLLVLAVVVLSWIAARNWWLIAPRVAAHPVLFVLDMCVSFAVLGIGGVTGPFLLATVLTATVAGLLYHWHGMLIVVAFQVAGYFVVLGLEPDVAEAGVAFQTVVGQPVYYPLAAFAGLGLRRILDEAERQETARRRAEVLGAAAEERNRLAREMHDSLAKTLRGVSLAAAALPAWTRRDPERAAAEAANIATGAELAVREARTLLAGLRDETFTLPLPAAVADLARQWGAEHGIAVDCDTDAGADPPLRARYEAVAILTEALANVERHADATSVSVRLSVDGPEAVLAVRDDGRGFRPRPAEDLAREGHYGLVGLHERAERVGGTVRVRSEPGAGTGITVRLPLTEPASVPLAEVG